MNKKKTNSLLLLRYFTQYLYVCTYFISDYRLLHLDIFFYNLYKTLYTYLPLIFSGYIKNKKYIQIKDE